MDLALLDAKLEKAFARSRTEETAVGTLKWRRVPAALWKYVEEVADEGDREQFDEGSLEYWPGSVHDLIGEHLVGVLGFYWDGFGPMSWVAGLQVLDCGDHGWLCYWDEMSSYQTVARLEPWRNSTILTSAVTGLLRDNGRRHGLAVFGSLPTETDNRQPRLLPTAVVKQAYFDWLQADDRKNGYAWDTFAEEHYSRIVEPNHLQRSLDLLARLPRLDNPDAVASWLDYDDEPELDDQARQRLFDEWFGITYTVTAASAGMVDWDGES